jgi:hypothetical protein
MWTLNSVLCSFFGNFERNEEAEIWGSERFQNEVSADFCTKHPPHIGLFFWPQCSLIQLSLKPRTVTIRVLDNWGVHRPRLHSFPTSPAEKNVGGQNSKPQIYDAGQRNKPVSKLFEVRAVQRGPVCQKGQTRSRHRSDMRYDRGLVGVWLLMQILWVDFWHHPWLLCQTSSDLCQLWPTQRYVHGLVGSDL